VAIARNVVRQCKNPTLGQAHLVFADTQSPNKKPKELEFLPKLDRKMINYTERIE